MLCSHKAQSHALAAGALAAVTRRRSSPAPAPREARPRPPVMATLADSFLADLDDLSDSEIYPGMELSNPFTDGNILGSAAESTYFSDAGTFSKIRKM